MNGRDELWRALNESFDRRRDPLADERVQRALDRDPDAVDDVAAAVDLLGDLERLGARDAEEAWASVTVDAGSARAVGRRLAAAAVLLVAAVTLGRTDGDDPMPADGRGERPIVLHFRSATTVESAGLVRRRVTEGGAALPLRTAMSSPVLVGGRLVGVLNVTETEIMR